MAEQLPTAADFFQSATGQPNPGQEQPADYNYTPNAQPLPSAEEFFAKPAQKLPPSFLLPWGFHSDADLEAAQPGAKRVIDAFGKGFDSYQMSDQTVKSLREMGVFNDYEKGNATVSGALAETLLRPALFGLGVMSGGFTAAQQQVAETATNLGAPNLGRELAAIPEAFPAFGAEHGLITPPVIAEAQSLRVIGSGEEGWLGTSLPTKEAPFINETASLQAQLAARELAVPKVEAAPEAPTPEPAPDIHAVARQLEPATFQQFDTLAARKDTFRRWISELRDSRDEQVDAQYAEEVKDLQSRLADPDTTKRLAKKYQARLDDINEQIAQEKQGDSPDMAKIRQKLMETDYAMRDLAPQVGDAYRRARELVPQEEPQVAEPVQPERPQEAPFVGRRTPPQDIAAPAQETQPEIANDVSQKLTAAGRPQEEADAAGALLAAHYEARAARFEGAKGTPEDLYKAEGPEIAAAEKGGRGGAAAGKAFLKNGKTVITLFKKADASTFIHETGHQWLDEMLRDAKDAKAPQDLKDDVATTLKWLGVKSADDIKPRHHEQFARGFEAYVMEGRAPNTALGRVFIKFRDWLIKVYNSVKPLKVDINNDIRDVFDRLITNAPDRPVVARDISPADTFADLHEADAEATPPEKAHEAANTIQGERDKIAAENIPEDQDARLEGIKDQTGRREAGGPQPDRNGPAPEPVGAEGGANQKSGAVGAGGSKAAPKSLSPSEIPTGPNAKFERPESDLIDKAGNIRLDNLNVPEDVKNVIRESADANDNFVGARRGVISDAQVLDLAEALGMDAARLNQRKLGEAFNAEQVIAARKLLIQSATQVRDAMIKAADGSDADVLAYGEAKARHQMIQEQVAGITAEAGRALRAFREIGMSKDVEGVDNFVREATGQTLYQLRNEAVLGKNMKTPKQVSTYMDQLRDPSLRDKVQYVVLNGYISGPDTHMTYEVAAILTALEETIVERPLAAAARSVKIALGKEATGGVRWGEVGAGLYGLVKGARDGVAGAIEAFRTGLTTLLPGEAEAYNLFEGVDTRTPKPQPIPGPVGYAIGVPGRAVTALHSFNRAVFYEIANQSQAVRLAADEGLVGSARDARIAELTVNPTAEMNKSAIEYATALAYMRRPQYGSFMWHVEQAANKYLVAKLLAPFMRIASNIIDRAYVERTPLGLLSQGVRDDLLGRNGAAASDLQIAKLTAGSLIAASVAGLVLDDRATAGGPTDPRQRTVWLLDHQPWSVRMGDVWVPYKRLGHIGMLLGFGASLGDSAGVLTHQGMSQAALRLVHDISSNVLDESWMRGISTFLETVKHPENAHDYIERQFSAFVPYSIGLYQTAHWLDPYERETHGFGETLQSMVPFWREKLEPRVDIFGNEIPSHQGFVEAAAAAAYERRIQSDPIMASLHRLDIGIAKPQRKIRGVALTDQQYHEFSVLAGTALKMKLTDTINRPWFGDQSESAQREMIMNAVKNSREGARQTIMARYPQIITDAIAAKKAILQH